MLLERMQLERPPLEQMFLEPSPHGHAAPSRSDDEPMARSPRPRDDVCSPRCL